MAKDWFDIFSGHRCSIPINKDKIINQIIKQRVVKQNGHFSKNLLPVFKFWSL